MLEELAVRNFALIENIRIPFEKGLNVITGETGAGKSILIGALNLLLGDKGSGESVRTGAEEAEISATVHIGDNPDALAWLRMNGIEPEDNTVIVRRILKVSGRGSVYVQGVLVPRSALTEFTGSLFDLHGQHDHQSLLSIDKHRKLLDNYAGLSNLVSQVGRVFHDLSASRERLETLIDDERGRIREMELLQFSIREIDEAALKEGESEELDRERTILTQSEKLMSALEEFHRIAKDGEDSVLNGLSAMLESGETLQVIDPFFQPLVKRLEEAYYEIEDVSDTVSRYREEIDFSPERLDECENRLQLIHRLKRKYGASIDAVLEYRRESADRLEKLENFDADRVDLEAQVKSLQQDIFELSRRLSEQRISAAHELEKKIQGVLAELGMAKGRFEINVRQKQSDAGKLLCTATGFDEIEFMIAPNPGEPLKRLRAIASGGEISRIMLAIKTVMAEADSVSSLIFDEVDAGVGGEIGVSVGKHLKHLAGSKQVICITHLASIGAMGANHIKVEKGVRNNRSFTDTIIIKGEERIAEIARMLSGDNVSSVSLAHAKELLQQ